MASYIFLFSVYGCYAQIDLVKQHHNNPCIPNSLLNDDTFVSYCCFCAQCLEWWSKSHWYHTQLVASASLSLTFKTHRQKVSHLNRWFWSPINMASEVRCVFKSKINEFTHCESRIQYVAIAKVSELPLCHF